MENRTTYDQYPGGENAKEIDGMTKAALEGLASDLVADGRLLDSDEGRRLVIEYRRGEDEHTYTHALTMGQLGYLLANVDPASLAKTPEQNRIDTLLAFDEVVAKYPASVFLPMMQPPALLEVRPQKRGWFDWFKGNPPVSPPKLATKNTDTNYIKNSFVFDGTSYSVSGAYRSVEAKTIGHLNITTMISKDWGSELFELNFGPEGLINRVHIKGVISPSSLGGPNLDRFEELRAQRTGKRGDIAATAAALDNDLVRSRCNGIRINLGYDPTIWFYGIDQDRIARYDNSSNKFIVRTSHKKKSNKYAIPADTVVRMLDEILSVLPVEPLIGQPRELR